MAAQGVWENYEGFRIGAELEATKDMVITAAVARANSDAEYADRLSQSKQWTAVAVGTRLYSNRQDDSFFTGLDLEYQETAWLIDQEPGKVRQIGKPT